jgi:hypothetical protein
MNYEEVLTIWRGLLFFVYVCTCLLAYFTHNHRRSYRALVAV